MDIPHSVILRSQLTEQPLLENFVDRICDFYNIGNTYFGYILLSLTEAFENAVIHGNGQQGNKTVKISAINTKRGLRFSISDQGNGFNPASVPDPTNPDLETDDQSGRGLFTITLLADEVSFSDQGSTINISFYVSSMNRELSSMRAEKLHSYLCKERIIQNKEQ